MVQTRYRLGKILHAMGVVTPTQIEAALVYQKKFGCRIGEALVKLGYATIREVTQALARQYKIPFIDLDSIEIPDEIFALVPPEIMVENTIVPVQKRERSLVIAMIDPLDLFTLDNLRFILGTEVECVLATKDSVLSTISRFTGGQETRAREEADEDADIEVRDDDFEGEGIDADDAPVVKLVNKIIAEAVKNDASDIHIEPMAEKLRIRYRIDGICVEQDTPPKKLEKHIISRIKIMSRMDMAEKRRPQDGRIKMKMLGKDLDFRVSSLSASHGESVVLRILDKEAGLKPLQDLGFHESDFKRFKQIIRKPTGIFLVTGPTGSGKTTTLYAALKELNRPDVKIITAEEPVEYNMKGINQVEVKRQIGLTFAEIIKTMLRQAPNIILVGEIRDKETADAAIQAALTGHLVFSTLHTNDAPSALTRLIDLKIPPFLVSSSVLAIMGQRLTRVLCPECREEYDPEEHELKAVGLSASRIKGITFYRPAGCEHCFFSGYRGRLGAFELMEMTSKLREMVFQEASTLDLRAQAKRDGMTTLQEDAIRKAMEGTTSLAEVLRLTQREDLL